jgi:hypothetical protein
VTGRRSPRYRWSTGSGRGSASPRRGRIRGRDDLMRLEPLDFLTSPVFFLSAIDE